MEKYIKKNFISGYSMRKWSVKNWEYLYTNDIKKYRLYILDTKQNFCLVDFKFNSFEEMKEKENYLLDNYEAINEQIRKNQFVSILN